MLNFNQPLHSASESAVSPLRSGKPRTPISDSPKQTQEQILALPSTFVIKYPVSSNSQTAPLNSSLLSKGPRTPGEDHPDVATTYNNLGNVYQSQGDYAKALEYHEKALRIRLKVLGDGRGTARAHPGLALKRRYSNFIFVFRISFFLKIYLYHFSSPVFCNVFLRFNNVC